ncbi:putative leucine-rich repeat receptor-like protein kinase, partial [Tanacetum coccineum]
KANAIAFDEIDKAPEEKKRGIIIAATKGTWHIARNKKKAIHILRGTKYQENFNVVLGKGEFGTVYHGYIDDTQVAVKILSESSLQGDKEFMAEQQRRMTIARYITRYITRSSTCKVTTVEKGAAGGGHHCSKCKVKSVTFMLLRDDYIITTVGDKDDVKEKCNCGTVTHLQIMSKRFVTTAWINKLVN